MLLVDDEQAETRELDAALQQPMRADHDVGLAVLETLQHLVDLARAAKARQRFDLHRPVGEAIREGLIVLLRQQRRRHQHRDLLAGLDGDERGAQRHLGLAEAHIAAHDAIHRLAAGEIGDRPARSPAPDPAFPRRGRPPRTRADPPRSRRVARPGARRAVNTDRAARRPCRECAAPPCFFAFSQASLPSLCSGAVSAGAPV